MPIALPSKPKRSPRRSSYLSIQKDKRQRTSCLEDTRWRPYRNSTQLALELYELTHEAGSTFDELERKADADKLKLSQTVALRLSELLTEDPATAEKLIELAKSQCLVKST